MDEGAVQADPARRSGRLGRDDLMTNLRALRGWLLAAGGAVLLLGCYLGVSKESSVSRQLPYVVSGGFGGLALVMVGGALIVADRVSADRGGQRRLERQVDDLHTLIVAVAPDGGGPAAPVLEHSPTVGRQPAGGPVPAVRGGGRSTDAGDQPTPWLAVPTGRTFHQPDCRLVAGKPTQRVGPDEVAERKLTPCRLCDPLGATVATG